MPLVGGTALALYGDVEDEPPTRSWLHWATDRRRTFRLCAAAKRAGAVAPQNGRSSRLVRHRALDRIAAQALGSGV